MNLLKLWRKYDTGKAEGYKACFLVRMQFPESWAQSKLEMMLKFSQKNLYIRLFKMMQTISINMAAPNMVITF